MALDPPIPGQTPLDNISGLRDRSITTRGALNAAEAENIRTAVIKYLAARPSKRSAPFDLDWIRRLHAEMFGGVWEWAGRFRECELTLGSPAYRVSVGLQILLDDLRAWSEFGMGEVEQATRLHHRAVQIHPFRNGNDRWSSMHGNTWLRMRDGRIVVWPESTMGTATVVRHEYLEALRAADTGDYAPLIELHERFAE